MESIKRSAWLLALLPPLAGTADCFCLVDDAENVRRDCVERHVGIGAVEVVCYDKEKKYRVKVPTEGWVKAKAGDEGCTPCETPPEYDPPRGNGDSKGDRK